MREVLQQPALADQLQTRQLDNETWPAHLCDPFAYVFDLGDDWTHLCTVHTTKIDPLDTVGFTPATPTAYWGWGTMPDQYDRGWNGDDGETPPPKRPTRILADLPPILPWWGPKR